MTKLQTKARTLESPSSKTGLVRIRNTKPKAIDLPAVPPNEKHPSGFESRTLIPGGNNVPIGHLDALKGNAGVRWYFDKRWLVVELDGEDKPEGPEAPTSLAAYEKPEAAIALVEAETNPATLSRWLANEPRNPVSEAISKRLATLKVG